MRKALILALCPLFIFVSCDLKIAQGSMIESETIQSVLNTITYDYNYDGQSEAKVSLTLARPDDPVRDGYTFTGWYTDSDCANKFTSWGTLLTESVTLYAGWSLIVDEWIYVDASLGDDAGNGSSTSPYKTIGQAISVAESGSLIRISGDFSSESVIITKSITIEGTGSSPVSANSEGRYEPVSGYATSSTLVGSVIINANDACSVYLRNFAVVGATTTYNSSKNCTVDVRSNKAEVTLSGVLVTVDGTNSSGARGIHLDNPEAIEKASISLVNSALAMKGASNGIYIDGALSEDTPESNIYNITDFVSLSLQNSSVIDVDSASGKYGVFFARLKQFALTMENSQIVLDCSSYYAISFCHVGGQVDDSSVISAVEITDSYLKGWAGFYIYYGSKHIDATITGTQIESINNYSTVSNDFAAVGISDSSENSITITGGKILVEEKSTAAQNFASIWYGLYYSGYVGIGQNSIEIDSDLEYVVNSSASRLMGYTQNFSASNFAGYVDNTLTVDWSRLSTEVALADRVATFNSGYTGNDGMPLYNDSTSSYSNYDLVEEDYYLMTENGALMRLFKCESGSITSYGDLAAYASIDEAITYINSNSSAYNGADLYLSGNLVCTNTPSSSYDYWNFYGDVSITTTIKGLSTASLGTVYVDDVTFN